ncbi:unnamed protein product [Penicillium roqueforti FM164]|uniref:Uncharacterized protein n=1 Tax=Penicillium roqueforti (strain FM164) TaxID=1365484 RepID=W6QLZ6_PENRF|nr:unnamed protein product [Penicillium roqueforti FM164]
MAPFAQLSHFGPKGSGMVNVPSGMRPANDQHLFTSR